VGRLDGKVAIVTGAARGQGEAISRRFAAEGARVVLGDVLDTEGKTVADELGEAARYVHHDVTDESSWDETVRTAVSEFGLLNVLINNAGIIRWGTVAELSLQDYMAVITVNQIGCFLGMKAVIPAMREAGGGSIVNTSSTAGFVGTGGLVAYTASKFAVRGMTKTAAIELGRYGIRVNSVHPGGIDTPMGNPGMGDGIDEWFKQQRLPMSRIGKPEEVASLMLFLASDESSYSTGSEFSIDGGMLAGNNPMNY
jgi:3alpha(or 20beta)-hydroxysteroid dehydrogenase